jgi:DNA polymerase I-like protein with 3'-5' exonuclease and polymerase domains
MIEFNPNSTDHLCCLFFGGELKDREQIKVGVYKTGQKCGREKYKWQEKIVIIKGLGLKPPKSFLTPKGNISLNEKNLSLIAAKKGHIAAEIASKILELRKLLKEISTYYEGMEELIHNHDSCIHGHFSHCGYDNNGDTRGGTSTGRLSSYRPNLQNLTRS